MDLISDFGITIPKCFDFGVVDGYKKHCHPEPRQRARKDKRMFCGPDMPLNGHRTVLRQAEQDIRAQRFPPLLKSEIEIPNSESRQLLRIFARRMKYLRLLLFPFSLVYGLIVIIRNWLYDAGLFKSHSFALPVISVGNLDVGGAGKTPMTEYLIRLLQKDHQLATLSRGYGRATKGYILAAANSTASEIGDEPAQFKQKFKNIDVAVCEDRVNGINQLKAMHDLILMDDAYQHRAVKPGFSILMFDYNRLQGLQMLLPAGNRREPFSGRWRADALVVSKCPAGLSTGEMEQLWQQLQPLPDQALFFTAISYYPLQDRIGVNADVLIDQDTTVFLITGIANPAPLLHHIREQTGNVIHHNYPDHHRFTLKNIAKLADDFNACPAEKKLIVTTEKDAQRLGEQELQNAISLLPVYLAPIGVEFLNDGSLQFDEIITNYVRQYK